MDDLAYGDVVLRLDDSVIELLMVSRIVVEGDVHAPWGPFKVAITETDRLRDFFAEAERRRVPVLGPVSY